MKVVFFGTPLFAVPTLQRLIDSQHEIVAVVTQPDKPAGRGKRITAPPVKVLAEQHGIPVHQPEKIKKNAVFIASIASLAPDVGVVVAYGKIIPNELLETPKHGCLNVHASLLPKYRGAGPIQWAIVRGETQTGVTVMQVEEKLDAGPMLVKRTVDILEDDDANSLADMLSVLGADAMVEVLDRMENGETIEREIQNDDESTYAPKIEREDARIDWTADPETIICAIRGFQPWPKAFTTLGEKELKIVAAEACAPDWVPQIAFDDGVDPGMVVEVFKGRGIVVRTGGEKGVILVTRVIPPGKPEMPAHDFANGGGIAVGTMLGR